MRRREEGAKSALDHRRRRFSTDCSEVRPLPATSALQTCSPVSPRRGGDERGSAGEPSGSPASERFKNRLGAVFIQHGALSVHVIPALGMRHYQRHFRRTTPPQCRHSTPRLPGRNDPRHTLIPIRQTDSAIGGTCRAALPQGLLQSWMILPERPEVGNLVISQGAFRIRRLTPWDSSQQRLNMLILVSTSLFAPAFDGSNTVHGPASSPTRPINEPEYQGTA